MMGNLEGLNFDANEVTPDRGEFEPIPIGEYVAEITHSEKLPNKKGTGHYVKVEMEIREGRYQRRKVWDYLNLDNPSAEAVNKARATLSAICRACGVLRPQDTSELHGIDMGIVIKHEKYQDKVSEKVKLYKLAAEVVTAEDMEDSRTEDAPW